MFQITLETWRYEISLLVLKKYFTRSLPSLVKYFSTLEEKLRISARPCNILYISERTSIQYQPGPSLELSGADAYYYYGQYMYS